jgi:hypothetical protein
MGEGKGERLKLVMEFAEAENAMVGYRYGSPERAESRGQCARAEYLAAAHHKELTRDASCLLPGGKSEVSVTILNRSIQIHRFVTMAY